MAKIDFSKIKFVQKNGSVHDIATATYHFFETHDGKYFQLDTYGTPNREVPAQASQKIQFNKKTAEWLIGVLCKGFGIEIFSNKDTIETRKSLLQTNHSEEEQEIKKVKRKIHLWFTNKEQINSKILYAFIKLYQDNKKVTFEELKKETKIKTFDSNFDQMKIISPKNHGKIFEQDGNYVRFWEKVEDIIWNCYNQLNGKGGTHSGDSNITKTR